MATKCSDPAVLAGLFLAAYSGNLADVKSVLKNNALSADVADPDKVREGVCENVSVPPSLACGRDGSFYGSKAHTAICFSCYPLLSRALWFWPCAAADTDASSWPSFREPRKTFTRGPFGTRVASPGLFLNVLVFEPVAVVDFVVGGKLTGILTVCGFGASLFCPLPALA